MTSKLQQRLKDAVEGRLPMEELTHRELQTLERLIFKAIVAKKGAPLMPPTNTRH